MIKKLRSKFITITMLSLLTVLLIILASINITYIVSSNYDLNRMTDLVIKNDGKLDKRNLDKNNTDNDFKEPPEKPFDKDKTTEEFDKRFDEEDKLFLTNAETPFATRYCYITLDENKKFKAVNLTHIASLDETTAKSYAKELLEDFDDEEDTGWSHSYKYRIKRDSTGYKIVILDASHNRSSILAVLVITIAVGIVSYLVVFLLVTLFSKKAIKPLAESYEKQKQFITDAGHELKTPLTVISADTEILSMTYGENEWTDSIQNQTSKMSNLIKQMITLSKMDEEQPEIIFEKFSLSDAVLETSLAFETIAGAKGFEYSLDIPENIFISGDEGNIRQLISILIDNAIKYCDENGKIQVNLRKNKRTELSVINSFKNVDEIETDRLFDRFYRGDKARTSGNSYGLGLSIAKSIANQHNAVIKAKRNGKDKIEFSLLFYE